MGPGQIDIDTLSQCGQLIKYAAENVSEPEKKASLSNVIAAIQESLDASQTNNWTPTIATKFWTNYNTLCSLISPVNTDTLVTTNTAIPSKFWFSGQGATTTQPQRSVNRYLVLLMALLISSVTLSFVTSAMTAINTEVKDLIKSTDPLADEIVKQLALLRTKGLAPSADFTFPSDTEIQSASGKITSALPTLYSNADKIYAKTSSLSLAIRKPYPICKDGEQSETSFCYIVGGGGTAKTIEDTQTNVDHYRLLSRRASPIADRAQDIANFLRATILPLLLGMTGACAYVVRMMSEQIKSSSYSSTSRIRNLVRVILGALAGVAIGFAGLFTQTTVSAVALSFLAGYAIEPVFATFDGIANKLK